MHMIEFCKKRVLAGPAYSLIKKEVIIDKNLFNYFTKR